ncbi:hypothetical protein [Nitrosophilus kaiyonis]|uniref:hypothetical protein n=1 Tax=Nitrosophilus kaiyonis TaxID=2930200 RepID=UPI0024932B7D|nr:hypothetical protein [Nitrosophilus kaiyonis]
MKILIGSPIKQKPKILEEFLYFLSKIEKDNNEIFYYFIDDNDLLESKKLLKKFYKKNKEFIIIKQGYSNDKYICDNFNHQWNDELIWKVANYKNEIINFARENSFDYLFLIDSDLLIHPKLISHLINANKDIISEVFWTKWTPEGPELPQVWQCDEYNLFPAELIKANEDEKLKAVLDFIEKLKKPGIYRVGGLGACTLISKKAINCGVSFDKIYNLSFWGEDRHFCIRAVALGFELYADTYYPPLHLYREDDLKKVEQFKEKIF